IFGISNVPIAVSSCCIECFSLSGYVHGVHKSKDGYGGGIGMKLKRKKITLVVEIT
ncbi:hypothetical protein RYX36_033102, partial [Vicia faba]